VALDLGLAHRSRGVMTSARDTVSIVSCEQHTETVEASGWQAVYIAETDEERHVVVMPLAFWLMTTCTAHGVSGRPMVRTKAGRVYEARHLVGEGFELTYVGLAAPDEDPFVLIEPYLARDEHRRATAS
jgi:hypothetical protein